MQIWHEIPHTADYAFRVYGKNLSDLFRHAAMGLIESLFGSLSDIVEEKSVSLTINLHAQDSAELMIDWLREILFQIEVESCLPLTIEIHHLDESHIEATLECSSSSSRRPIRNIKAITYHQAVIHTSPNGLVMDIVCDC